MKGTSSLGIPRLRPKNVLPWISDGVTERRNLGMGEMTKRIEKREINEALIGPPGCKADKYRK